MFACVSAIVRNLGLGLARGSDHASPFFSLLQRNLGVLKVVLLLFELLAEEGSPLGGLSEGKPSVGLAQSIHIGVGDVLGALRTLVRHIDRDNGGFSVN